LPYPALKQVLPGRHITACVDYENSKLEWKRYETDSGIVLRVVALPLSILSEDGVDEKGMPVYLMTWHVVMRVTAPENQAGAPTPLPHDSLATTPTAVVLPEKSTEPWNEFMLNDGHTIKAKLIVTEIRRYLNCFDRTGMPLFTVNSKNVWAVSPTPRTSPAP